MTFKNANDDFSIDRTWLWTTPRDGFGYTGSLAPTAGGTVNCSDQGLLTVHGKESYSKWTVEADFEAALDVAITAYPLNVSSNSWAMIFIFGNDIDTWFGINLAAGDSGDNRSYNTMTVIDGELSMGLFVPSTSDENTTFRLRRIGAHITVGFPGTAYHIPFQSTFEGLPVTFYAGLARSATCANPGAAGTLDNFAIAPITYTDVTSEANWTAVYGTYSGGVWSSLDGDGSTLELTPTGTWLAGMEHTVNGRTYTNPDAVRITFSCDDNVSLSIRDASDNILGEYPITEYGETTTASNKGMPLMDRDIFTTFEMTADSTITVTKIEFGSFYDLTEQSTNGHRIEYDNNEILLPIGPEAFNIEYIQERKQSRSGFGVIAQRNITGYQKLTFESYFNDDTYRALMAWHSWARQGKPFKFISEFASGSTTLDAAAAAGQKVIPTTDTNVFSVGDNCLVWCDGDNTTWNIRKINYSPEAMLLNDSFNPDRIDSKWVYTFEFTGAIFSNTYSTFEIIEIASISAGVSITAVDNLKFSYNT